MTTTSPRIANRGRRVLAVLLAGGILVAACGNSDDDSTQSADSSTTTTAGGGSTTTTSGNGPDIGEFQPIAGVPGVTDTEIDFAVLGTGPSNPLGYCLLECYQAGVQAYFDYRNSLGGIQAATSRSAASRTTS